MRVESLVFPSLSSPSFLFPLSPLLSLILAARARRNLLKLGFTLPHKKFAHTLGGAEG
jgi:hypothetical protein